MANGPPPIKFSPQQVAFLNEMYPEKNGPSMSPDERLWNAAQRNLIASLQQYTARAGEPY